MHRFLSQIARILQVNRLMEVAHVVEGALESWDRHRADRAKGFEVLPRRLDHGPGRAWRVRVLIRL
jgi:hypothetical protein